MSHLCGHHRKPLTYGLFSVKVTKSSQNYHLKHHPERLCRAGFNRTGASKCTSAFSCFILFFDFSVSSMSFQFSGFIIFIVLFLLFFVPYGTSVGSNGYFFSGVYFPCDVFYFPISTALLLRPTLKIDFKVLTALLGFGYERLTFQGGVTTLP